MSELGTLVVRDRRYKVLPRMCPVRGCGADLIVVEEHRQRGTDIVLYRAECRRNYRHLFDWIDEDGGRKLIQVQPGRWAKSLIQRPSAADLREGGVEK